MKKNLFSQKTKKEQKKPYRSRPIRRIGKTPKQTSKERYYKDKGVRIFNEENNPDYAPNRVLHIDKG